jgi:hypothetical protein
MSSRGKTWVVVSVAVALVFLVPLCFRWQAQWSLSAYRKKLIAAGEKLTVPELAPKTNPQATNTGLFLKLALAVKPFEDYRPTAMLAIKPGVARVASRQPHLIEKVDAARPAMDVWPALADAVSTNKQTLDQIQALMEAGGIEFDEDYNQLSVNGMDYLSYGKRMVIDLNAAAMLALHLGQTQKALLLLNSCDSFSQDMSKDQLEIYQLVSWACTSITATGCWEALQAGGWTDDQLVQLQHQWDRTNVLEATESSLVMERAIGRMMFQAARVSRQGLVYVIGPASSLHSNAEIWNEFLLHARKGVHELIETYPRYWGWRWIWSYRDEQRYLEFMKTMIDTVRVAQKRREVLLLPAMNIPVNTLQFAEEMANVDTLAAMKDNTKRYVLKALRAQTEEGIVRAAIALERYRLARHVYPSALHDLVPQFLSEVPIDCMDGHDLRYRLNSDGTYLLYSVGDDGVDNGGDPIPSQGRRPGFLNGRDWVWPRPATADEVQVYETEQSKPTKRQ